jgi:hypothetical protein
MKSIISADQIGQISIERLVLARDDVTRRTVREHIVGVALVLRPESKSRRRLTFTDTYIAEGYPVFVEKETQVFFWACMLRQDGCFHPYSGSTQTHSKHNWVIDLSARDFALPAPPLVCVLLPLM